MTALCPPRVLEYGARVEPQGMRRWMRQLLLVGVMLGAASSPAREARTTFTVGAQVVESCEVSMVVSRGDALCAAAASRELRAPAPLQAPVSSERAAHSESTRSASSAGPREATTAGPHEATTAGRHEASSAGPRAAATIGTRVLLIRF